MDNRDENGRFMKGHLPTKGFQKGQTPWNKGKYYKNPKISIANKGKRYSPITEFKKGKWQFEGSLNEYRNLHKRINKSFGKPDTCEHCGRSGLKGKQIHWANKDGRYKEDRKDWLRLCPKCHFIQGGRRFI